MDNEKKGQLAQFICGFLYFLIFCETLSSKKSNQLKVFGSHKRQKYFDKNQVIYEYDGNGKKEQQIIQYSISYDAKLD